MSERSDEDSITDEESETASHVTEVGTTTDTELPSSPYSLVVQRENEV